MQFSFRSVTLSCRIEIVYISKHSRGVNTGQFFILVTESR